MMLQRRNGVLLCLVLSLLLCATMGPGFLSGSGLVPFAWAGDTGQSLASFALPTDNFSEKAAAMLNHVGRDNYSHEAQFVLKDVRAFFEGNTADSAQKALEEGRKLLLHGKEQYDNLELDGSIEELAKAASHFEKAIARLGNGQEYLDSLLYLGAAYILSGDTDRANEAFRKVAMYDRRKTLDPKLFPPSMIEMFNKVKDEVGAAPVGTVLAKSNPSGAEVYLNGVFKGITPVPLSKVPEGTHFMRVEKDGYIPAGQTVEFSATHEDTVELKLKEASLFAKFSADSKKLLSDIDEDPPPAAAVQFGQWLGVSRLVLVSIKQRGDEVGAEAAMIQINPPKRLSAKSATLNLVAANFLAQANALFTALYRNVEIPASELGAKKGGGTSQVAQARCNSESDCTTGEVCESGHCIPYAPEKKHFYETWWFWTIVGGGLAVAAGTGVLVWYFTQPERGAIEFTF